MAKIKYHFNTSTLKYERVIVSWKKRLLRVFGWLATAVVFGALIMLVAYNVFDSPKEKRLKRQLEESTLQLELLKQRADQVEAVLGDLQERDNTIYRVIFEAEPIPQSVREAGFGGAERYRNLRSDYNGELLVDVTKRIDKLSKQLYVQSKSFDEVWDLVKNKNNMLASIPAIQPVANKDLTRVASGYGMRIHPIYKTEKMHTGMDFTSPVGTEIHATGNGVVNKVEYDGRGYGNNVIISHGFGYQTLYGHMSKILVRPGQKVSRGDLIGYVGNTGTSTGPHLHYEVLKGGKPVNPVNYYYNDLTPEEYQTMLEISSKAGQSFD
ncbi:MAG: M23 family metallopeptidase [Bacteroidota bacterium]|jgi:murein DD-endopeptidase MepM/ murein hydrolase activator NlpD|uniref:M23 family metallopeptidase n=1 Tax=Candidatus Pollutiaquabacter sp. TaxID=3416354 RepID=UPI001A5556F2|nr:M23 family metallopeptidase [Bacteroidota bacterium]MBL7947626.1 M23 family metallopeptidase [Bacteroidia bacterium]HPD52395.1 M23 family metallopeptidase [Bacteroidia bacterium]HRI41771.1 M23 family metallopeptidase [Bacteroidia bacterium]HRU60266.1 M23 family metallopeptidase [Bacteroidia bacterium]